MRDGAVRCDTGRGLAVRGGAGSVKMRSRCDLVLEHRAGGEIPREIELVAQAHPPYGPVGSSMHALA